MVTPACQDISTSAFSMCVPRTMASHPHIWDWPSDTEKCIQILRLTDGRDCICSGFLIIFKACARNEESMCAHLRFSGAKMLCPNKKRSRAQSLSCPTNKDLTPQSEIFTSKSTCSLWSSDSSVLTPGLAALLSPPLPIVSASLLLLSFGLLWHVDPSLPVTVVPNTHHFQSLPVFILFFHQSICQRDQSLHGFLLQLQQSQASGHGTQDPTRARLQGPSSVHTPFVGLAPVTLAWLLFLL